MLATSFIGPVKKGIMLLGLHYTSHREQEDQHYSSPASKTIKFHMNR
jgi:hypothetical protein